VLRQHRGIRKRGEPHGKQQEQRNSESVCGPREETRQSIYFTGAIRVIHAYLRLSHSTALRTCSQ
jgi:hypothetical protein